MASDSGDYAADLEVDDGVPVEPEFGQDGITVFVEVGRSLRGRGFLVELHGCAPHLERGSARRPAWLDIAVGDDLGVVWQFEGILYHSPLSDEVFEAFAPFRQGSLGEGGL